GDPHRHQRRRPRGGDAAAGDRLGEKRRYDPVQPVAQRSNHHPHERRAGDQQEPEHSGPGARNLSITSTTRDFDNATPGVDVTISGLGFGSAGGGVSMGGAILNRGGHLTVANDSFTNIELFGSGPGGSAKGGAIASTGAGATLTVRNSTFNGDGV